MLDLTDLDRWARVLDGVADDVERAEQRLSSALAQTAWVSTAADRFRGDADELRGQLRAAARDLAEAADALRAHATAVRAREAQLGEAAGAMLDAARAAASRGADAVAAAMDGAEQAFHAAARAARERLEQGARLVERGIEAIT